MAAIKRFTLALAALVIAMGIIGAVPSTVQAAKIALVDMEKAVNNCKQGKVARAELERKAKKLDAEVKKRRDEVRKLAADLESSGMLLKREVRLSKQREYERKARAFQDLQRDAAQELRDAQARSFKPILSKMRKIVRQMGKKGGFDLVLGTQVAFYFKSSLDLTGQVILAYDKSTP